MAGRVIGRLLEWVAPHVPTEDQAIDGPDTRSFWDRVHDAETEDIRSIWEYHRYRNGGIGWPSVDVHFGWSLTHFGLGVDVQVEQAGTGVYGGPGSLSVGVAVGLLWFGIRREWLNEDRQRQEWIALKSFEAARRRPSAS